MTARDDLAAKLVALENQMAAAEKRAVELEAKLAGIAEAAKPPKPVAREPYQPIDYTSGASMNRETMRDLAAGIKRDRDQLWAEAAAVEATGEPLVIPEKLWPAVKVQQQARMEIDAWVDVLAPRLAVRTIKGKTIDGKFAVAVDAKGNGQWRVSTDYLLNDVLSIPIAHQHNNHTKRLAAAMSLLGWSRNEATMRIGEVVKRGYTKPIGDAATEIVEEEE